MNFYANSLSITFNDEVFVCEFSFRGESVCIILSPSGAKTLSLALKEHVEAYQKKYGEIDIWDKTEVDQQDCNGYRI